MAQTTAFSHLLAPGLRKVFFDTEKRWPSEYDKIASVETSKRAYEEELTMAGLGLAERKPEGRSIVYDEPIQGNKVRYTHVTYALGFRVSREAYDDDLYGPMQKMSKQLATSMMQTVELEFGGLLDDAFSGSVYTAHDGQPLCSTAHVLLNGGSYQNRPTVHVDLGIGSLRAARQRMESLVNERGIREMRLPSILVVSPEYQWVAEEITKSQLYPYSSENRTNSTQDIMQLKYMVNHYMSDADQWLLLTDKSQHDIKFLWRMKSQFDNSDDFDTKDAKFSVMARFSLGFTDWRGVDGSSGG